MAALPQGVVYEARQVALNRTVAVKMILSVAAIAYAHGQGVLHRDIRPSNVLIDGDDEPRLTNFGLAKRVDNDIELTASGQVLGTPGYMPPEQALGAQADMGCHSDVYSLGALLYALLTGRPPFQADNVINTLAATVALVLVIGILVSSMLAMSASHSALVAKTNEELAVAHAKETDIERKHAEDAAQDAERQRRRTQANQRLAEAETGRANMATNDANRQKHIAETNLAQAQNASYKLTIERVSQIRAKDPGVRPLYSRKRNALPSILAGLHVAASSPTRST